MKLILKKLLPFFIILVLFSFSCKDDPVTPPPPPIIPKDTINISIADLTHRSISINIISTANNPESFIRLYRLFNSSEILLSEYPITIKDTTIIDDDNGAGLLLNTGYSYYAVRTDTVGERKDSSNLLLTITLDTTSHSYTWQEWVIGEWQSSLFDVWGTDENNVWACGLAIINDTAYGVLKWNGSEWIPDLKIGGKEAIFGFSSNSVWLVGNNYVGHFNGNNWNEIQDPVIDYNGPYTSLWGTSSSNMYFGTEWGKIIHWNGSKASDMGIKDDLPFIDILGFSADDIYAVTGIQLSDYENRLYHFNGTSWNIIKRAVSSTPQGEYLAKPLLSVYAKNSNDLFVAGRRINRRQNGVWKQEGNFQLTVKIRGSNSNNIVAVGTQSKVHHYNGNNWKDISPPPTNLRFLEGAYVTENKIFIVGQNGSNAIILIGTKN